jgi:predicted nucleotidyltransferase
MKKTEVERNNIVATLVQALKPLDYIHAVWEGGAASFNRVDEWSDIDLYVVCDDERVEDTFVIMEHTLGAMSEIELKFRLPEPTWHGHSQVFWRLKNASPFLFLDIAVMRKSSKDKFLQYHIHGRPHVHFDKIGIVKDDPVDRADYFQRIKARLDTLKTNFELFQVLVLKELNRGNDIEALSYYLSYTYRPLVEVLRIKHCPWHHRFYTTYIYYEMPSEIVNRLHHLYFITNAEALRKCREEAEMWFWETVRGIDYEQVRRKIFESEE